MHPVIATAHYVETILVLSVFSLFPGENSSHATMSRHGEVGEGGVARAAVESIAFNNGECRTNSGNNLPGDMNSHLKGAPDDVGKSSTILSSSNLFTSVRNAILCDRHIEHHSGYPLQ